LLKCLVISAMPQLGNWCQPTLLSASLEAQPPMGKLLRDRSARTLPDATPAFQPTSPFHGSRLIYFIRASVDEATFRRRGMHDPHIPVFPLSILERSVGHRSSYAII
jgi:hypothetical protein